MQRRKCCLLLNCEREREREKKETKRRILELRKRKGRTKLPWMMGALIGTFVIKAEQNVRDCLNLRKEIKNIKLVLKSNKAESGVWQS